MIGHKCMNCLWWDDKHEVVKTVPRELCKTTPGICRKHKPGAIQVGQFYYGVQPIMDANDFCGEFREDN